MPITDADILTYHLGGKVRFLSGRMADPEAPGDKKVRNIRNNGHTPKIPYLNSVYTAQAEKVVVVEGATDAVTLAKWGIPALALAGSTMAEASRGTVRRTRRARPTIRELFNMFHFLGKR